MGRRGPHNNSILEAKQINIISRRNGITSVVVKKIIDYLTKLKQKPDD